MSFFSFKFYYIVVKHFFFQLCFAFLLAGTIYILVDGENTFIGISFSLALIRSSPVVHFLFHTVFYASFPLQMILSFYLLVHTGQHIEPSLSQADPSNATYFSFIIISLVLFSFLALFTCLGCCGAAYKSGCMLGR